MTKPLGIIRNLEIHIHGTPYIATFIVLKNNVVEPSYSMLLGRPWLRNAKVTHDWGNNVITVQGNGTFKTISVNRKLGVETRRPQLLVYYGLMESLTYEEEDLIFEIEPKLILIGTIIRLEETILLLSVGVSKIKSIEEFDLEQGTSDQTIAKMTLSIVKSEDFCVKLEVSLEEKAYLETYYHHTQDDIQVDETPAKI